MSMTSHSVVCATCGIDVPWEEQFCVHEHETDNSIIVCPRCAAHKFGVDVGKEHEVFLQDQERWG